MSETTNDADVKITVLKRTQNTDGLKAYADTVWPPCQRLTDGQEFISRHANMPEGFCSWAWADIQKYVLTLARGGNFRGVKPGTFISCCTDGFRPVIFKIQRI